MGNWIPGTLVIGMQNSVDTLERILTFFGKWDPNLLYNSEIGKQYKFLLTIYWVNMKCLGIFRMEVWISDWGVGSVGKHHCTNI